MFLHLGVCMCVWVCKGHGLVSERSANCTAREITQRSSFVAQGNVAAVAVEHVGDIFHVQSMSYTIMLHWKLANCNMKVQQPALKL